MSDFLATAQAPDPTLLKPRSVPKLTAGAHNSPDKARKAAEDFEAVFLSQMIQPMFEGIEAEEPFGGGSSEQTWRSMQIDEYGKALARNGGIGIADSVMQQLLKVQESDHMQANTIRAAK